MTEITSHRVRRHYRRMQTLGKLISVIQAIVSAVLLVLLVRANLLPFKLMIIIIILLVALFVLTRVMMRTGRKKGRFIAGLIIALVVIVGSLLLSGYVLKATNTLHKISNIEYESTNVGVYVLDEDPAQTIEDAKDYTFGYAQKQDVEETNSAIEQINKDLDQEIDTTPCESVQDVADQLLDGDCQAMIMTESFVEMLGDSEEYEDFDEEVRLIATYEYKTEVVKEEKDTPSDVFTMYISGIDAYGGISTKSRSDVNILATVNTNTGEVLLITTPRDYYVPLSISNGEKDKLTHAGIYGIDVSVDTMEMIYDTDIDYYFRVNFSGFEQLIDALGGIDVYSDYEFDPEYGDHVNKGMNHFNGEQALGFARERHAFAEGDRQRGKDQMIVIAAVIDKMQSSAVLRDFNGLMEGLEGSFETDMPYSVMSDIVKKQLSDGTEYHTSSYSVDGTGTRATTYSMNQSLYVMEPDQATIDEAKSLIEAVKSGEMLNIDDNEVDTEEDNDSEE